jgi:dipeptidyl aminopeptidase/acylaminoacyl peptidase
MLLRLLLLTPLLAFAESSLVADWQKQYDTWYWPAQMSRPENVRWSDSGRLMAYSSRESSGQAWKLADCSTGQVRPAFDHEKVAAVLSELTKNKVTAKKWPFSRVIALDDGRVRLESDTAAWVVEADQRLTPSQPGKKSDPATTEKTSKGPGETKRTSSSKVRAESPTGEHKVELRGGNVILVDLKKANIETQLTQDGIEGKDGWVGPINWSPDGRHFALWRERTVPVRQYLVTDSVKQTKKPISYDKPGDDRTERTPWVFSVDGKSSSRPLAGVLPFSHSTERLDWSADSQRLHSEFIKRGFTGHGVIEYDVVRRSWRRLLTEEDPKFVHSYATRYRYDLNEGRTLWLSERSGWLQLYLVDLKSGKTLAAVTSGPWVMKEVIKVDEEEGAITFIALGRIPGENPYHQHFCKVGLDGRGFVDLTPSDGHHEVIFSPDRRTLIDISSRVDQAPTYTLRSGIDGRTIATLASGDLNPLKKAGWTPAMPFVAKDRDGKTDIWGVVTRPYPFDPKKKYPVIENIYAGPHGSFAPRSFNWWNRNHRELSMLGFYVVQMDGRGTSNRGKEFHQVSWRNLKDGGFPDRIAWIKSLAKVEPNMDLSRVGIYGGSAGGQNTAHALLLHGDFYKAGAADCGCYDNRIDKLWWNEQWLGYPVGPWYEENSCARYAANLRGRLFLSVGEADTNVDVKCSYDFRDALLAAGKKDQFEFHVVPGANHGAGESNEMREKRARFFESALGKPSPL